MGESFFHLTVPAAQKRLEHDTERIDALISELEDKKQECIEGMSELKVHL